MPDIRYLKHSEIDFQRWDALVSASQQDMIYFRHWYLDAICDQGWDALVLGDYEAVFPLPVRRKMGISYIYQPFFCQQLGLVSNSILPLNQNDFLNAIPHKFKKIHLQIHDGFALENIHKTRANYLLNLADDYQKIAAGFNRDARQNLKKAEVPAVVYGVGNDIDAAIEMHRNSWGAINDAIKEADYKRFAGACREAQNRNCLELVTAIENQELIATGIFIHSGKYIHYMMSAPTEAGRKYSVMHGVVNYMIRKYAGRQKFLDFEGSEIPEVAHFYRKWGAVNHPYFVYFKRRWL